MIHNVRSVSLWMLVFCTTFLAHISVSHAQIKLALDRFGKKGTLDFHEGDEMLVRLKNENHYRTLYIKNIYPDANAVNTQHGLISLDKIVRIKTRKKSNVALNRWLMGIFSSFSGSTIFYTLIDWLAYGATFSWIVVGGAIAIPLLLWGIMKILNTRTYKVGKRRKLRIIDLRMFETKK